MLVTYSCNNEVIVTTETQEAKMLKIYFDNGGRDIDDYDREIHTDVAVDISNRLRIA